MNIEEIKKELRDLVGEKKENLDISTRLSSPEHNTLDFEGWEKMAEIDKKEYELLKSVLEFLDSQHPTNA